MIIIAGLLSLLLLNLATSFLVITSVPHPRRRSNSNENGGLYVTIKDDQIELPNGIKAQVVSSIPASWSSKSSGMQKKKPILFLHGSFHGAWCWQENYIPYFVDEGYPCIAFSWRGTAGTPAREGKTKVSIVNDHCQDLNGLLELVPSILGDEKNQYDDLRPIVVSHSMGGIVIMKYLEEMTNKNKKPNEIFSGIVSMCSVPPSGNGKSTMRVIRRSLIDAYKITVGFVLKKVVTDESICRQCFFGDDVTDSDIKRYQRYFGRDSKVVLDVRDLSKVLPSKSVNAAREGRAPFASDLPQCLVVGATDDFIVDEVSTMETAAYYAVNPVYIDSSHDVMLGSKWENGAKALKNWIENTIEEQ